MRYGLNDQVDGRSYSQWCRQVEIMLEGRYEEPVLDIENCFNDFRISYTEMPCDLPEFFTAGLTPAVACETLTLLAAMSRAAGAAENEPDSFFVAKAAIVTAIADHLAAVRP